MGITSWVRILKRPLFQSMVPVVVGPPARMGHTNSLLVMLPMCSFHRALPSSWYGFRLTSPSSFLWTMTVASSAAARRLVHCHLCEPTRAITPWCEVASTPLLQRKLQQESQWWQRFLTAHPAIAVLPVADRSPRHAQQLLTRSSVRPSAFVIF